MTHLQVGIALVTRNSMAFLNETLASIEPHLSEASAIHVVDDFSDDDTEIALSQWIRHVRTKGLDAHVRPSTSRARNLHTRTAQNFTQAARTLRSMDLIALADHDDRWLPNRLTHQAATFAHHPHALMLAGNGNLMGDEMTLFDVFDVPKDLNDHPCEQIARHVIRNSVATGSASMIRSDLLRRPQGIPPQGWLHDRWWSLAAASHCGLRVDQEPVIDYRVSLDQQIGLDRGRQGTTGLSRLTASRLSDVARMRDMMALHQYGSEAARGSFSPTAILRSLIS